jgi:hypothetical protein
VHVCDVCVQEVKGVSPSLAVLGDAALAPEADERVRSRALGHLINDPEGTDMEVCGPQMGRWQRSCMSYMGGRCPR